LRLLFVLGSGLPAETGQSSLLLSSRRVLGDHLTWLARAAVLVTRRGAESTNSRIAFTRENPP